MDEHAAIANEHAEYFETQHKSLWVFTGVISPVIGNYLSVDFIFALYHLSNNLSR